MGSTSPSPPGLPDASSPTLILMHPTPAERQRTWSLTHPKWGGALEHDDYLAREQHLTETPLTKDGGITHWILTDSSLPPDQRPILSSCESLRKRAVASSPSDATKLQDGIAHGICSVFTDPQFRGRGYASRMMRDLGGRLKEWQGESLFSVLYSDIGKAFYARHGWAPFESAHLAFPPSRDAKTSGGGDSSLRLLKSPDEVVELCAADEKLLRRTIIQRTTSQKGKRRCVALLPDERTLRWHLMREDFMTEHIFGRTTEIRGAVYGSEEGKRLWAVWARGYYGGLQNTEGNALHILRFVVEDESLDESYLVQGAREIIEVAQREAAEWKSEDVQMWNPTDKVRELIDRSELEYEFVDRDSESITSLMWYGEEETADLDWVANEKYAWC
ncbi:hypothetical protein B0H63DRAFT_102332 [Podospora didyma]|uniref:LYC1 C-terminal domain-containing protein n=1 Tax=Podospora didyma TaxID=330526 RepID=A0AAE0NXV6_9PEZI|nr:hypothetical protein B0H63DRAFT_102332 [Podospora didyma]